MEQLSFIAVLHFVASTLKYNWMKYRNIDNRNMYQLKKYIHWNLRESRTTSATTMTRTNRFVFIKMFVTNQGDMTFLLRFNIYTRAHDKAVKYVVLSSNK